MQRIGQYILGLMRCGVLVAFMATAGCSLLTPQPEPEPQQQTQPVEPVEPEIVIEAPQPVVAPTTSVTLPGPSQLPPITIVLTSSQPAYADIAEELTRRLDKFEIYNLADDKRPPVTILRLINDSESGAVVAIGLRAASSSVAMANTPVIFSQVFNYQDHGLLTENSRGISATAPLAAQLAAWKQADPTIVRVGAILGDGHDDLIAEAQDAAEQHGIELRVQVTHSDQETLYFFKRMIRDIDGFWLFPDNRVLSGRALQQIMHDAKSRRVPILVQSESLLKLGASISVSTVASDIAETITRVIRQIQAGGIEQVPAISPLSEVRVTTTDSIQVVDR